MESLTTFTEVRCSLGPDRRSDLIAVDADALYDAVARLQRAIGARRLDADSLEEAAVVYFDLSMDAEAFAGLARALAYHNVALATAACSGPGGAPE